MGPRTHESPITLGLGPGEGRGAVKGHIPHTAVQLVRDTHIRLRGDEYRKIPLSQLLDSIFSKLFDISLCVVGRTPSALSQLSVAQTGLTLSTVLLLGVCMYVQSCTFVFVFRPTMVYSCVLRMLLVACWVAPTPSV